MSHSNFRSTVWKNPPRSPNIRCTINPNAESAPRISKRSRRVCWLPTGGCTENFCHEFEEKISCWKGPLPVMFMAIECDVYGVFLWTIPYMFFDWLQRRWERCDALSTVGFAMVPSLRWWKLAPPETMLCLDVRDEQHTTNLWDHTISLCLWYKKGDGM